MAAIANEEIHNLFSNEKHKVHQYKTEDYYSLNCFTQTTSQISFTTAQIKDTQIIFKDSYVVLDLSVAATGATATSEISLKEGVASIFSNVQVSIAGGTSIVNQQNVNLLNGKKLLLKDYTWAKNIGPELCYDRDTGPAETAVYATAQQTTTSTNAAFNQGLLNRVNYIIANSLTAKAFVGGILVQTFRVYVPLSIIHDWFAQMNYPISGVSFQIDLFLAHAISPWQIFQITDTAVNTNVTAINTTVVSTPYLYYKGVTLNDDDATKYQHAISHGLTKTVNFISQQVNYSFVGRTETSISMTPFQNIVRPLRLWCFAYYANELRSVNNTFSPSVQLDYFNVLANNKSIFQVQPIMGQRRLYDQLRNTIYDYTDDMAVANLTFADFLSNYKMYVFDLSRVKYNTSNLNTPVQIDVVASRLTATPIDFIYIIEYEDTAILHLSDGNGTMVNAPPQ